MVSAGEVILIIVLLVGMLYFFGFFDRDKWVVNSTSPAGRFFVPIFGRLIGTLGLYLTLAMWHKLLGPYIFGG